MSGFAQTVGVLGGQLQSLLPQADPVPARHNNAPRPNAAATLSPFFPIQNKAEAGVGGWGGRRTIDSFCLGRCRLLLGPPSERRWRIGSGM